MRLASNATVLCVLRQEEDATKGHKKGDGRIPRDSPLPPAPGRGTVLPGKQSEVKGAVASSLAP